MALIIVETMKQKGFSPYGPSKAALESMSIIWAQELYPFPFLEYLATR
jgi:hypothetical protein